MQSSLCHQLTGDEQLMLFGILMLRLGIELLRGDSPLRHTISFHFICVMQRHTSLHQKCTIIKLLPSNQPDFLRYHL